MKRSSPLYLVAPARSAELRPRSLRVPRLRRWAPFAFAPLLAVGLALIGGRVIRGSDHGRAETAPLPGEVATERSTIIPDRRPAAPTTPPVEAEATDHMLRAPGPPLLIEVTVADKAKARR